MIKIICVGKIKETYLKEAIKEYCKRLSKYTKIEIVEIDDVGGNDRDYIQKKEKEALLKVISLKDYIITLEIEGITMDSIAFAQKIDDIFTINSNLTFIVGGSYGLDPEIKKAAKFGLSFSKMTFPHQLFRVMLLEQLYRAFKLKHNEEYHK